MLRGQQVNLWYPLNGLGPGTPDHKVMRISMTQAGFCPECGLEVANPARPEAVGENVTRHRNDFHDPEHRLLETCGVFPREEQLLSPKGASSRGAQGNIAPKFSDQKK